MNKVKKIVKNSHGSMYLMTLGIVVFMLFISIIVIEILRVNSIQNNLEYELQRAINIAVEEAMYDTYRQDKLGRLDVARAKIIFYDYLKNDLMLNAELEKYKDDDKIYFLEINSLNATDNPAKLQVKGTAKIKSVFTFLQTEIEVPFSISSRNRRLD